MAAPIAGAQAAESSDRDEIIVTATRSGTALVDLATSVSVVGEEELSQQLDFNTNVMRALEFAIPGLAPQRESRSNCSPNIRGRQTSIQVNGIPVNENIRQSTCDQMYQLSPFAIERVEVLRGGTALYGAGSPGGVINFITRRAKGRQLEVDVVAQTSFNTSKLDDTFTTDLYGGVGQKLDGWDYYVGAAYTDGGVERTPNGGLVPGREYESVAFNGSLGVDLAGGELRVTGTWYREDKGQQYSADGTQDIGNFAPVIPVDSHPQLDEGVMRSTTVALFYDHPDVLGHSLSVSGYYQDQLYRQRDNFFDLTFGNDFFASDSYHDRFGFRSTLVKKANLGAVEFVGSYGFDYTYNSYYRPAIDPAAGDAIFGYVSPEVIFNTYALFGQIELDFGRLRLVGGARQEWYRGEIGDRDFDPAIPGSATPGDLGKSDLALYNLGAVFDVTDAVQLYGGFSQGAEIAQLGRAARGQSDPSLITPEPATSDQFELGIRGRTGGLRFEVAGFRSTSDRASLLQEDQSCAGETLCPLVPLRARQRFWGFEGSADWQVSNQLDLAAVVTWQRGKIFDEGLGRFIEYSTDTVAPFRLTGSASYRPIEPLSLSLQGTYYGAADYYTAAEQAAGFVNTESTFLMDASIRYQLGKGELFVAASNLLDEKYVSVADQGVGFFYYQAEGRRVTVGYKARF
ncbi:siderophore receptor [Novosphingobium endophyticum]|uniref:Siderophore receptor n=1 Tax=Novosphingobium endophyticum TaxID=1955250 RepID=A0A916TQ31_9SPHN|nr:TonB-dependent receptor [Novosphingobium endophyticum]GGB89891.1 siderophore receptor [Novosphingobium endophyticum]